MVVYLEHTRPARGPSRDRGLAGVLASEGRHPHKLMAEQQLRRRELRPLLLALDVAQVAAEPTSHRTPHPAPHPLIHDAAVHAPELALAMAELEACACIDRVHLLAA